MSARPEWRDHAKCAGLDPTIFFPDPPTDRAVAAALLVCRDCPVIVPCSELADEENARDGVWGGVWRGRLTDDEQRRRNTARRRRQRAEKRLTPVESEWLKERYG